MRSYLIVGNQTLDSAELDAAIRERVSQGPARFHVTVPATPINHGLTWDEDEAREAATERLAPMLERLRALGVEADGEVGVADPVEATADALRGRAFDEVVLSTLPPGISRWLGQDVPSRLKGTITVPVSVVISSRQPAPSRR